jgi:predicted nucleic acid-binding protein
MTPARKRPRRVREREPAPAVVLLDANVIFDALLLRAPWHLDAARLFESIDDRRLTALIAVHTVTTIWYVLRRELDAVRARAAVRRLLSSMGVASLDGEVLQRALELPIADFEDACQVAAAERAGVEAIVTRDVSDFQGSPVPLLTPVQLVARLGA